MSRPAAYYNEFDPAAAAWLRELVHQGLIAPGGVDERSIKDVRGDDLRGYAQCHFFAGTGIWSHALRRAGWDDDRPVGTASCPCQGFSIAGRGLGFDDPRHLWPDYLRVFDEAREQGQPWTATVFGEQSDSAGAWLDLVQSDLEARAYAFAATDIPAAGFSGAHRRQRFYWVADADHAERWADLAGGHFGDWPQAGRIKGHGEPGAGGAAGGVGDPHHQGLALGSRGPDERGAIRVEGPAAGATGSLRGCDWLLCHDARVRPVESGTFPLAPSNPSRVGLLRGYGNALDAETATQFVSAFMEAQDIRGYIA